MGRPPGGASPKRRVTEQSHNVTIDVDPSITDMTPMNGLEPVCSKYIRRRKAIGKLPRTVEHDELVLRRLTRWNSGPILYLTHDDLTRWQVERSERIESGSLRAEMSALRGFFGWAHREGLVEEDPTARLDMPRVRRYLPRPMAEDRIRTALAAADPTMKAIIALGALGGLRCCEIAGLEWQDVDQAQMMLRLVGKGGRERVVPMAPGLLAVLEAMPPPHRGALIRRRDGKAGTNRPHTISHWANGWLHSIGLDETMHQLRHAFATALLEATEDLRVTQEAMGHATPATTAIYTRVRPARLRAGVDAAASALLGMAG